MSRIEVQFSSGAFMPGELLFCKLEVSNDYDPPAEAPAAAPATPPAPLAWVAVQVHGVVGLDLSRASEPALSALAAWMRPEHQPAAASPHPHSPAAPGAARKTLPVAAVAEAHSLPPLNQFGPHAYAFLSAPLTILATDVQSGQTRQLLYYLLLPPELPPSYKGAAVRFSYYLTVAAQRSRAPAKISRFPIRVLNPAAGLARLSLLASLAVPDAPEHNGCRELDAAALHAAAAIDALAERWCAAAKLAPHGAPASGAVRMRHHEHARVVKLAQQQYRDGQQPASFAIAKGPEPFLRLSLDKTAYQLGEVLYGTLDFSGAAAKCLQVSVWLESVEEVAPALRSTARGHTGQHRRAYCEHHEYTLYTLHAHFMFQIPVEAAHEFRSDLVSLSWVLRFEFVSLEPADRRLEPLFWELPIRILVPTHPSDLLFSPHFTLL